MTTIDGLPSADDAARARELRRAYELVEKNGEPGRATTSVLHQLGLMIAGLIDVPARDCRSCGTRFGLSENEIEYFRSRGLNLPTHCRVCRKQRRQSALHGHPPMRDAERRVAADLLDAAANGPTRRP